MIIDDLKEITNHRKILIELIKRDFRSKYVGSYLGLIWVFLQPTLFLIILYFVVTLGFKAGKSNDMPFAVYLITGMIVWMYFSQILGNMPMLFLEYRYMLSNVQFRIFLLPFVKIFSSMPIHIFFICITISGSWCYGIKPSMYYLQIIYYLFASICFLIGIGWIVASTNPFAADINKIVSILIQFGFWVTPIFWSIEMIPANYQWLVKLNPIQYLVQGYRDSIITQTPIWNHPLQSLYFWGITLVMMIFGFYIFNRLRPHFSDVI